MNPQVPFIKGNHQSGMVFISGSDSISHSLHLSHRSQDNAAGQGKAWSAAVRSDSCCASAPRIFFLPGWSQRFWIHASFTSFLYFCWV